MELNPMYIPIILTYNWYKFVEWFIIIFQKIVSIVVVDYFDLGVTRSNDHNTSLHDLIKTNERCAECGLKDVNLLANNSKHH